MDAGFIYLSLIDMEIYFDFIIWPSTCVSALTEIRVYLVKKTKTNKQTQSKITNKKLAKIIRTLDSLLLHVLNMKSVKLKIQYNIKCYVKQQFFCLFEHVTCQTNSPEQTLKGFVVRQRFPVSSQIIQSTFFHYYLLTLYTFKQTSFTALVAMFMRISFSNISYRKLAELWAIANVKTTENCLTQCNLCANI